jgi:hypothetical protein
MTDTPMPPRVPLQTQLVLDAVRAAQGPDGRLATPDVDALGDIFPFEGEMLVKAVDAPTLPEPPRGGEEAPDCPVCGAPDDTYLWVDDRWRLQSVAFSQRLPVELMLEPRTHLDLGDLDDAMAGELGRLVVAVERAIAADPGVGRVHVHRWGDGLGHLHLWFLARPAGLLQLRGSALPVWLDVLPPLDTAHVAPLRRAVAQRLAETYGGCVIG